MPVPRRNSSRSRSSRRSRSRSLSSDEGSNVSRSSSFSGSGKPKDLPPPVLVYHESARSIVFRDQLRRSERPSMLSDSSISFSNASVEFTAPSLDNNSIQGNMRPSEISHSPERQPSSLKDLATEVVNPVHSVLPSEGGSLTTQIAGYQPNIVKLESMELSKNDQFQPLLDSYDSRDATNDDDAPADWTTAEVEVVSMLREQRACVKTIQNTEWTSFLKHFLQAEPPRRRWIRDQDDKPPTKNDDEGGIDYPFNSFVTSTSILPEYGLKMRCFGSVSLYTTGVVFALPRAYPACETEDEVAKRTLTWSWPAGYSAKTEYNIDGTGRLINGREEALRPLSVLRQYNSDYVHKDEYMVGMRMTKGLNQIPYNEVFLRVGGLGRIVDNKDCATSQPRLDEEGTGRSFDRGVGLPVALFVRQGTYGHLISLLRTRARLANVLGDAHIRGIPLLLITPDHGVRVLTESLQRELWKIASHSLNPFQNPTIAHKTNIDNTVEESFQQKVEELIDLDDSIREMLTPEELARLAGGFGATDDSVATILKDVMIQDRKQNKQKRHSKGSNSEFSKSKIKIENESHRLQDVVNEGLAHSVRSGDYHTSRQLLILYSLVASCSDELSDGDEEIISDCESEDGEQKHENNNEKQRTDLARRSSLCTDTQLMKEDMQLAKKKNGDNKLSTGIPRPPPPPPLDTERLRSATNSDGLLAVLGAAEVLKSLQNGDAKRRIHEAVEAVEEWVSMGEQSVAFRISSWYDQKAAQGDLQIATEQNTKFMAFVSNKAITNRKNFAQTLKDVMSSTDFDDLEFLQALDAMLRKMHSPCLRLELLQYALGLDNRYSVAHVTRSVELAATCLGISSYK